MCDDGFYKVLWLRGDHEVARHAFGDLLRAKGFARDRMHIQKIRKGADLARVVDADGVQYFEFRA